MEILYYAVSCLFISVDSISTVMLLLLLAVGLGGGGETDMRVCMKSHSLDWSRKFDPSLSQRNPLSSSINYIRICFVYFKNTGIVCQMNRQSFKKLHIVSAVWLFFGSCTIPRGAHS